jgi:UDP-N-acetylmuramoyl-L-alanyl-D-glutamate--2,6-diaminopimelate ligase
VTSVAYRSDKVSAGGAFFCIRGFAHDGHDFALDAASRGAAALVVERRVDADVPQFVVDDARAALASASASLFQHPSRGMDVVGITGTNGKTTTTYLVDGILRAAGRRTGLIGTVETRIAGERQPSARTTPESYDLQVLLARMRDAGVTGCAMEVSSHAIDLHRVDAMRFAVAAFTNLTQDHLDFHHTIEEYFSVKRRLFTEFDVGAFVVNVDDPFGVGIAAEVEGAFTIGRSADARVRAEGERLDARGTTFTLVADDAAREVRLPLAGAFNVSNALVAAGTGLALGLSLETIVAGLESAPQVPGRLEQVECGQQFSVVVDYAHTPDSLEKAIAAVRGVTTGRVIVVFGCGGDRDPDKRPVMGAASSAADHVVITSDNPRSEDPVGIILQIEDGARGKAASYEIQVDRRTAIASAIASARPGDAVLIAGKGHEDYQVFADRTVHFDDREVAREVLGSC